jgi:hypothetical protein
MSNKIEIKTKIVGAGGVANVVECMPSKCESLGSNPSNTKKDKNCY